MAGEGLLSLRWNNHRTSFMQVLSSLWDKHKYSDVTLACAGKFYSVHKFVLSTCSDYFLDIVENTPCTHPTIVLKDIRAQDLEALLNYMYLGEVNVLQTDLSRLIKAAECLRIKGLAVPDESPPQYPDESRVGGQDESTPQTKKRRNDDDSTNSLPSPQRKKRNGRPHSVEPGDSACSRDQEGDSEGSGKESHDHHDTISHLNTSPAITVRDTRQVQGNFCEARIKTEEEEEEEVKCEDETGEASEACLAALEVHLSHSDPPQTNQGKYDPQQAIPGPPLLPQPYPSQPQSFEEIVSQALPGPSGLQGDGSSWDGSRVKGDIAPFHLQGFTQQMRTPRRPCHFCHKEFAFASDLERHMRIHTGEKPFACPLCPYRSSQRYNLLRHRRVHMIKAVSEWHPQPPSPLAVKAGEWSQPPSPPLVVKVSESLPHSPTPPQSSPVPP